MKEKDRIRGVRLPSTLDFELWLTAVGLNSTPSDLIRKSIEKMVEENLPKALENWMRYLEYLFKIEKSENFELRQKAKSIMALYGITNEETALQFAKALEATNALSRFGLNYYEIFDLVYAYFGFSNDKSETQFAKAFLEGIYKLKDSVERITELAKSRRRLKNIDIASQGFSNLMRELGRENADE